MSHRSSLSQSPKPPAAQRSPSPGRNTKSITPGRNAYDTVKQVGAQATIVTAEVTKYLSLTCAVVLHLCNSLESARPKLSNGTKGVAADIRNDCIKQHEKRLDDADEFLQKARPLLNRTMPQSTPSATNQTHFSSLVEQYARKCATREVDFAKAFLTDHERASKAALKIGEITTMVCNLIDPHRFRNNETAKPDTAFLLPAVKALASGLTSIIEQSVLFLVKEAVTQLEGLRSPEQPAAAANPSTVDSMKLQKPSIVPGSVLGLSRLRMLTKSQLAANEDAKSYLWFTYDLVRAWPPRLIEALSHSKPDEPLSLLEVFIKMHKDIKERGGIILSDRSRSVSDPNGTDDWTKVGPMIERSIQAGVAKIAQELEAYGNIVQDKLGEEIRPYSTDKPGEIVSPKLLESFGNVFWRNDLLEAQSSCLTKVDSLLKKLMRLASMRLLVWVLKKSTGAYNIWKRSHDNQQVIATETLQSWESYRQSLLHRKGALLPLCSGNNFGDGCKSVSAVLGSAMEWISLLRTHVYGGALFNAAPASDLPALKKTIAATWRLSSNTIKDLYNEFAASVHYRSLPVNPVQVQTTTERNSHGTGTRVTVTTEYIVPNSSQASRQTSATTTPTPSRKSSTPSFRSATN